MTKFRFENILTLCLAFPENSFNFTTQKFAKNWNVLISKVLHVCLRTQGSFKTISKKLSTIKL